MGSKVRTYGRQHRAITVEASRRRRQSYMQESLARDTVALIPRPISKTPIANKLKRRTGQRVSEISLRSALPVRQELNFPSDSSNTHHEGEPDTLMSSNDQSDYSLLTASESCYSGCPSDPRLSQTGKDEQAAKQTAAPGMLYSEVGSPYNIPCNPHSGVLDINAKLTAMMVSSRSLAANRMQPRTQSLSTPRGPKVLDRVSNALNRLSSPKGPQHRSTPRRRLQKAPSKDSLQPSPKVMAEWPHFSRSSLSTIQLRLNEGDNLNRSKVQRIVGGSLKRKPVPASGRLSRMTNNPSQHTGADTDTSCESTTLDGHIPDLSEERQVGHSLCLPMDLFATEAAFDDNIEARILSMSPIGSSTPRICVIQFPADAAQVASNTSASSISELDLDKSSVGLCPSMLIPERTATPKSYDSDVEETAPAMSHTGSDRTKKHPSPSKNALESLEVALQGYFREKSKGSNEPDELAVKNHMVPGMLQPQNPNTLVRPAPRNISNPKQEHHPTKELSKHRRQHVSLRYARDSRFGATCPLSPPAKMDDLDELCY